jgi:hypothetical protein
LLHTINTTGVDPKTIIKIRESTEMINFKPQNLKLT